MATTKKRLDRTKLILSGHAGQEFLFSDKKQCPKLSAVGAPSLINIARFRSAASVMLLGAISRRGKLPLVFVEKNVKINTEYYKTEVLEKLVAHGMDHYVFQQNGAPPHTTNFVQPK